MELDYIDRWSLWLDLKILVKTVVVVLKGTETGDRGIKGPMSEVRCL